METRASWTAALAALAILSVTYGAPLVLVVALKPIAGDLDTPRSIPALASSLAYFGTGLGGIPMGWVAERVGMRRVVVFGALCVAAGMLVSTQGGVWGLYVGHGLLIGLLGNGSFNAPMMTYVTRWFDRRRGTALALITSGQYIAGAVWPTVFERGIEHFGWRWTMLGFGALEVLLVLPVALLFLSPPPPAPAAGSYGAGPLPGRRVLGWPPNLVLGLMSLAVFLCCVPMALPAAHLVSFCTDLGFSAAHGAAMLSVLLACAFVSRQFWGWIADRIGGLRSVLIGSTFQAVALACFLATQDEIGLFTVAAAFGLGFSGIVPAYVLGVRELFPASEAGWRVPVLLFFGLAGMAVGGWMGGAIYDHFGNYAPAFVAGVAFNVVNLVVVGTLVARRRPLWPRRADRVLVGA
ncbi:MFS transporter [Limobrevibacterium gyesilva]|uniref:MFS transporter n=1 Tax=Limobrevibacterium gyesilva TaxID=2991712 RepID=UPI002227532D